MAGGKCAIQYNARSIIEAFMRTDKEKILVECLAKQSLNHPNKFLRGANPNFFYILNDIFNEADSSH